MDPYQLTRIFHGKSANFFVAHRGIRRLFPSLDGNRCGGKDNGTQWSVSSLGTSTPESKLNGKH